MPKEVSDGALPNRLEPNVPVSLEELEKIGVLYFPLVGPEDPNLKTIREERGYSYEVYLFWKDGQVLLILLTFFVGVRMRFV